MSALGDEHRALLKKALEGELSDKERAAFEDMLRNISSRESRYETLSKAQARWIRLTIERQDGPTPTRFTDGGVPRGREVASAPALENRPLVPPGRRAS